MTFKFALIKSSNSQTVLLLEVCDIDIFGAIKQAHNKSVIEFGHKYADTHDLFMQVKG